MLSEGLQKDDSRAGQGRRQVKRSRRVERHQCFPAGVIARWASTAFPSCGTCRCSDGMTSGVWLSNHALAIRLSLPATEKDLI